MEEFGRLEAVAAPIVAANCDTDQIIAARYLQKPRSDDFGRYLFRELRFHEDGGERSDFVLNRPSYRAARLLVANRNFGCGSSREHAPWALLDFGIRCVISTSFADIFFANCLKNGVLPIVLPEAAVLDLLAMLEAAPGTRLVVDLPAERVELPNGLFHRFDVEPFAKHCLVNGMDELDYTLSRAAEIDAFETRRESA